MRYRLNYVIICMFFVFSASFASQKSLKVLHLSFHKGCINDFEEVAKELNVTLTSWYIHTDPVHFEGKRSGNAIYNITAERAARVWNLHKNYFEQFDVIVTSDTAPLSRIFLQHNWKKPLIIWVCNRFDYADGDIRDGHFPDQAYYELFKNARTQSNVKIISYTTYEHFYARHYRGIDIGTRTITPLGQLPGAGTCTTTAIPSDIIRNENLFLYPRMEPNQLQWIQDQCASYGIKTHTGSYNGPDDLIGFKGILYFPYAWSNLAVFEDMQRGLIHFMPSIAFTKELIRMHAPIRFFTFDNLELCEWYNPEYKDVLVYFDSWNHLAELVKNTDYELMSKRIKVVAQRHRARMLSRWREVFDECTQLLKTTH